MIHWIRPAWFWALIPTIIIWLALWRHQRQTQSAWQSLCDPHLLPHLMGPATSQKCGTTFSWITLGLIWLITIATLAGPSWTQQQRPTYHQQRGRMVLLDLSSDMLASDLTPNRLTRARFKLIDFLNQLHTGQIGLIAFSQWPYLVSPLTEDTNTIKSLVPQLSPQIMPSTGYDLSRALDKARQTLVQGGAKEGDIIVMTGRTPNQQALATAQSLARQGYQTIIWGFGTATGGPIPNANGGFDDHQNGQLRWAKLNTPALQQFAKDTNGRFVQFTNSNQAFSLLSNVIS